MEAEERLAETEYDAVVIGTGLAEAVTAFALARAGLSVLHTDPGPSYGGVDGSTLTLKEFQSFIESCGGVQQVPSIDLGNDRHYNLDICAAPLLSASRFVDTLIDSGVARYLEFVGVSGVDVLQNGVWSLLPADHGGVFRCRFVPAREKRDLLRFLQNAVNPSWPGDEWAHRSFADLLSSGPCRVPESAREAVMWGLTLRLDADRLTAAEGLAHMRMYAASLGRFCGGALLWPLWGASEPVQAFCRACAVCGGTYVLRFPFVSAVEGEAPMGEEGEQGEEEGESLRRGPGIQLSTPGGPWVSTPIQEVVRFVAVTDRQMLDGDGEKCAPAVACCDDFVLWLQRFEGKVVLHFTSLLAPNCVPADAIQALIGVARKFLDLDQVVTTAPADEGVMGEELASAEEGPTQQEAMGDDTGEEDTSGPPRAVYWACFVPSVNSLRLQGAGACPPGLSVLGGPLSYDEALAAAMSSFQDIAGPAALFLQPLPDPCEAAMAAGLANMDLGERVVPVGERVRDLVAVSLERDKRRHFSGLGLLTAVLDSRRGSGS